MLFDFDKGEFGFKLSNNMGMDSDGNMMMRVGGNMAMDMDSGELHFVSGWDEDDDNFNSNDNSFGSIWDDEDDW